MATTRVFILGAGGRVWSYVAAELLRHDVNISVADITPSPLLEQRYGRLVNDVRLARDECHSDIRVHGDVDALDLDHLTRLLSRDRPDVVVNYAIPITWDAAKRLPNYDRISAAGLGAFVPIQVLTPLQVGRAISAAGLEDRTAYVVGNLPDITVPTIAAIARAGGVRSPECGAGNVALNQVAFRSQVARDLDVPYEAVDVSLVSHHVHWVAPREPGYSNEGPFFAQVRVDGEDITDRFDDLREVMNRGVVNHYESGATFSSTTGMLASQVALALLDETDAVHRLHAPAANGLPGGYPISIQRGAIAVDLPDGLTLDEAVAAMNHCHTLDGVRSIGDDGTVTFTEAAQAIIHAETGFALPATMTPADIEAVADEQIRSMRALLAQ